MSNMNQLVDIIKSNPALQTELKTTVKNQEKLFSCLKGIAANNNLSVTNEDISTFMQSKKIDPKDLDNIHGGDDRGVLVRFLCD